MRSQEGKDFFNLSPSFSEPFPALPLSLRRGGLGGEVSLDINFCQEFLIANEILYRTFKSFAIAQRCDSSRGERQSYRVGSWHWEYGGSLRTAGRLYHLNASPS